MSNPNLDEESQVERKMNLDKYFLKIYREQDKSYFPQSVLIKYFTTWNMRKQNPALDLFYKIIEQVECRCKENECGDPGDFEPCFGCQKIGNFIAELDAERWIKYGN